MNKGFDIKKAWNRGEGVYSGQIVKSDGLQTSSSVMEGVLKNMPHVPYQPPTTTLSRRDSREFHLQRVPLEVVPAYRLRPSQPDPSFSLLSC